jgi:hypothetical protein
VRAIAARLRCGERPDAPEDLVRSAKIHLANRARYDARRAQVRMLATEVRAGRKPRVPRDLMDAAQRHLAYRQWYNDDRISKRRDAS